MVRDMQTKQGLATILLYNLVKFADRRPESF